MTIVAHESDNTISEKAEASCEESGPQRLIYDDPTIHHELHTGSAALGSVAMALSLRDVCYAMHMIYVII